MARDVAAAEARRFGRAAGMLSVGIGSAGLLTYVYFSLASHNLDRTAYGEVVVLWSAVFVTMSILFQPSEQLLSRTITERQTRGQPIGQPMRVAATIQLFLAAAFPVLSLTVVPLAFAGRAMRARVAARAARPAPQSRFTLAHGGGLAAAVLLIMISEQSLLNAGPLIVRASEDAAAAGFIFNVLMIARAPLVLFQAVTTSLIPHLTRLRSSDRSGDADAFRLSIRVTLTAIAAFAAGVALIVLAAGPHLMQLAFGTKFAYDRLGLVVVSVGMGFYLASG